MSIVPAPPQVFGRWVKRQVLVGLALTVALILFFVVRAATRAANPFAAFEGQRLWVTEPPAPRSYGAEVSVALTPGDAPVGAKATVWPTVVSQPAAGGGAPMTWDVVQVGVVGAKGLVRDRPIHIGTFALLGETRTIDGAVWQEAWRMPQGNVWREAAMRKPSLAGTWRLEGKFEAARALFLGHDGGVYRASTTSTSATGDRLGRWYAHDGVIVVSLMDSPDHSAEEGRRVYSFGAGEDGPSAWLIARVASDERSFKGVETSGAAVTGTRDE